MTGSSIQVPRVPELSLSSQKSLERFAKSIETSITQQTSGITAGLASTAQITALQNSVNLLLQQFANLQKQVNNFPAGAPGAPGAVGPAVSMDGDYFEDWIPIPGAMGAAGVPGPPGVIVFMDGEPGEDGMLVLGGAVGLQSDELAATTSAGPYPLSLVPDGRLVIVTLGSGRVPPTQYSFVGPTITFSGVAATQLAAGMYAEGSVNYSYSR